YGYNKGYTGWDLAKSALIGTGIGACLGAVSGYFIGGSISELMAAKTLWTFTQLGSTIGGTVGTVGGTVYGLAKKADGLELANYVGLGSLIGMAAGAAIGAGCYGLYSYYASASAEYMAQESVLEILSQDGEMITPGELHAAAESPCVTPSISDVQSGAFASSEGGDAMSVIKSVGSSAEVAPSVSSSMQVAVGGDLSNASLPSVANAMYRQPVGIALRGVALRCTYGAVAVGIGGTTGACFGYHYLSKFLFDQSSYLYGD
ncbi:MAG: hypothetical protein II109_03060, partial [Paludibacteraceae bacterium]|nr:hypothetical protein [Paludibacteraceae bacterium]